MNFFNKELEKILADEKDKKFVGRACFIKLDEYATLKIEFSETDTANVFNSIRLHLFDSSKNYFDHSAIYFSDLFGVKKLQDSDNESGIVPHIWEFGNTAEWYGYKPTKKDYKEIYKQIKEYISLHKEFYEKNEECERNKALLGNDLFEGTMMLAELEDNLGAEYYSLSYWLKVAYESNKDFHISFRQQVRIICRAFDKVINSYGEDIALMLFIDRSLHHPKEIIPAAEFMSNGGARIFVKDLSASGFFTSQYSHNDLLRVIDYLKSNGDVHTIYEVLGETNNEIDKGIKF